jgi:hypothetical protein
VPNTAPPFYPPPPAGVPADLTRPDAAYRSRVAAMTLGLVFYLAVIAAVSYLAYKLFTLPPLDVQGRGGFIGEIAQYGGAVALALLTLFLVKGLFKRRRPERKGYLEIKPDDHPDLFAFIQQVYRD